MIEQLKTLLKFVDRVPHKPSCVLRHHADNFCDCGKQETLAAISELERMVGEPVLVVEREPDYMSRGHYHEGTKPYIDPTKVWGLPIGTKLYAAPPVQQPQARPDFNDEWTGYLKDGETPFERFMRERKDLNALTKLYQRALEENERLKDQQPQAPAVPAWTTEQITAVAQPIALEIAENCKTAPQLVFPYLFLGLKALLTTVTPQQPQAEMRAANKQDMAVYRTIAEGYHADKQPQAEAVHRYVLELPDDDKREAKVCWLERKEGAGEITHHLCILVEEPNQTANAPQEYTRADLDRAYSAGLVEGERLAIKQAAALKGKQWLQEY